MTENKTDNNSNNTVWRDENIYSDDVGNEDKDYGSGCADVYCVI